MPYLITALLFLLIIGAAFGLAKKTKLRADNEFPYQKIRTFLSPAERSFLGVLEKSLGGDYRVFSKIRLADVVKAKNGLSRAAGQRAFNSISAKHVDFLICNSSDMSVMGAIELDDRTHDNPQRVRRDLFVDKVFEASQIPLLRVKARAGYSIPEITGRLKSCGIIKPEGISGVENGTESINAEIESRETTPSIQLKIEPVCPRCGAGLVKKVATKGRYAGRKYLGCSNFPHCRYAEGITDV
jgi:Protein of unknown function (DUF2726)/Topoisomerase DNA binding C4 zinc finger